MKFPIPQELFPSIEFSTYEKAQLQLVKTYLLDRYLEEYDACVLDHNRLVDKRRWKRLRQSNQLALYRHRKQQKNEMENVPLFLIVGKIEGALEDILYGSSCLSKEEQIIRTHYTSDRILDTQVLCEIEKPTEEQPFQSLCIKWYAQKSSIPLSTPMINTRDYCFLSATGIFVTHAGVRIGYEIQHSIHLPEFPPFNRTNDANYRTSLLHYARRYSYVNEKSYSRLIRGKIFSCRLIRQKPHGRLEIFHQLSTIPSGILAKYEHLLSLEIGISTLRYRGVIECSFGKKLLHSIHVNKNETLLDAQAGHPNRFQHDEGKKGNTPKEMESNSTIPIVRSRSCAVCVNAFHQSDYSIPKPRSQCAVCENDVCRRCYVLKEIPSPLCHTKFVTKCFCKLCLMRILGENAGDFVRQELSIVERRTLISTNQQTLLLSHQPSRPMFNFKSENISSPQGVSHLIHWHSKRRQARERRASFIDHRNAHKNSLSKALHCSNGMKTSSSKNMTLDPAFIEHYFTDSTDPRVRFQVLPSFTIRTTRVRDSSRLPPIALAPPIRIQHRRSRSLDHTHNDWDF